MACSAACSRFRSASAGSSPRCSPTCSRTRASPGRPLPARCWRRSARWAPWAPGRFSKRRWSTFRVGAPIRPRGDAMPKAVRDDESFPDIARSEAWYARAEGLIPAGTQTLAKGPGQYVRGVAPKYLARGKGCHVWDVDGNEYIDFQMGIGPLSLGYAYEPVDAAIRAQLAGGITFSLMHPLEGEVAELVRELVPGAESVRYSKTGCDATTAAGRVARAWTGRARG